MIMELQDVYYFFRYYLVRKIEELPAVLKILLLLSPFLVYNLPKRRKSVAGEIVLITGTGHDIGRELALLYASEGATVVGWDKDSKSNEETISQIFQNGYPQAYAYQCDLSNRAEVIQCARDVEKDVGEVTILINNPRVMPAHSLIDLSRVELEKAYALNVFAHLWPIRAFLPSMEKNNYGHIVAISFSVGMAAFDHLVPYCASKCAVAGLMEELEEQLGLDLDLTKEYTVFMKELTPKSVAKEIMDAQRRNKKVKAIPGFLQFFNQCIRWLPRGCRVFLYDVINSAVISDPLQR